MKKPNWKVIAQALFERVQFSLENSHRFDCAGIRNRITGEIQSYTDYLIEGLEQFPGVKVNREAVKAMRLPRKERDKFFAELEAKTNSERHEETNRK